MHFSMAFAGASHVIHFNLTLTVVSPHEKPFIRIMFSSSDMTLMKSSDLGLASVRAMAEGNVLAGFRCTVQSTGQKHLPVLLKSGSPSTLREISISMMSLA